MSGCCLAEFVGWSALAIIAANSLYNVCHFIYTTFLGRLLGHGIDLKSCGPWAVVTGATDGIGKSFAKQLAAARLNVVLISRNSTKLQKVADEIKSEYSSIQVKTIAVDFTESQKIYNTLRDELNKLQIGILVNNVGMLIGFGQRFGNIEDDKGIHDIINCNVLSMARMCHIVLPQMTQRKKGVIVNVGSLTSTIPTPYLTIYGATKAFVDKFSRDLAAEVKSLGVTIQTVHPGYVATNMASHMKPSLVSPHPDTFAAATLNTLGLEQRTAGYWTHKIQLYFTDLANFFVPRHVLEKGAIKHFGELKKAALKKTSR
ncbi:very-long-chain 3-oxoacyl-CoA reductase-like [Daphnia carinata]|uniref:very-long-chain 3-oxoacyl-CoA reductase-like n=1 Tax=Daphnia carinata TaxID=120202 RepID=UPI00257FAAA1|nr:very-long-chain 3-oxoacyl-CoA reductase-like [Daphnia carinata]